MLSRRQLRFERLFEISLALNQTAVMVSVMNSIARLNQDAGTHAALSWLKGCESIISNGHVPSKLSSYGVDDARRCLFHEYFYEQATAANRRWWLSDKNWEVIKKHAIYQATNQLTFNGESFPKTLAHFSKP